jgi:hypothetical protein
MRRQWQPQSRFHHSRPVVLLLLLMLLVLLVLLLDLMLVLQVLLLLPAADRRACAPASVTPGSCGCSTCKQHVLKKLRGSDCGRTAGTTRSRAGGKGHLFTAHLQRPR